MDNKSRIIKYYIYCILFIICILFYLTCSFNPISKKDFMSFGQEEEKKDKKNEDDPNPNPNPNPNPDPNTNPDPINNVIEIKSGSYTIASNGFFSFDTIEVSQRELPVTFTINNIGDNDLLLTGNPVISIDNNIDFKIEYTDISNKSNKIEVNNFGVFTITFKSLAIDGKNKITNVNIKNNLGNDYNFTISCIAKRSESQMITSSGTWLSPCYGSIKIYLAGGGGGGGGSSEEKGAGGGGAGWLEILSFNSLNIGDAYTVVIGNGGSGGAGYGTGGIGGVSCFIDKNLNILLKAEGGFGGFGATNDDPGLGGELNGNNGTNDDGGDGGYIILKGQNMGYGEKGTNNIEPGKSAPPGSGGGGGGAGDSNYKGSPGGNGGSGFIYIEWTGFTN